MDEFCRGIDKELENSIDNDPLKRCGENILAQMCIDPVAAQRLADDKLHVFPFKDVDVCWRRLYTDAGIRIALKLMLELSVGWLNDVVKQLDMILIMTGAPLREEMIERIFNRLAEQQPSKTRRAGAFNTSSYKAPEIEYPVPRSELSLSQFEKLLGPHVIENSLQHWPAFEDRPWKNPSYLLEKTFGGSRLVPVEIGRSYTDEGWGQTIIPFRDFLDQYVEGSKIGYLAQHNLFAQIPGLRKDIAIPDFCYATPPANAGSLDNKGTEKLHEPLLNAWFGPAGTISPLHTDPYHNILCQVVGKKYVRLYAPGQTAKLYPRGLEEGIDMSNTSRVPVEKVEMNFEEDEYPLFGEAPYVETILHEGDCLYIPVGWWHYVRALTVSFNVSFWWN